MKRSVLKLIMMVALTLSASIVMAYPAANLGKVCNDWNGSVSEGGHYSMSEPMTLAHAYGCEFFITGYALGIKGTMGADDKGVIGTYTFEKGVTPSQLVKVFTLYLSNHPEEENKQAGDVIFHALTNAGLLTVVTNQK